jgi:transcriptional regulator with XRE-family HTH domain
MKPSEHIKKYMEKHQLDNNQLAKALGVSRGTVANYLTGRTIPPKFLLYALRYMEEKGYWNRTNKGSYEEAKETSGV